LVAENRRPTRKKKEKENRRPTRRKKEKARNLLTIRGLTDHPTNITWPQNPAY